MQLQLAIKVVVIFVIALLILVPINMVRSKIYERQAYLGEAKASITNSWTGQQRLSTPVVAIPYTQRNVRLENGFYNNSESGNARKVLYVFPDRAESDATVENRVLHKGIYDIPVYLAKLQVSASFNEKRLEEALDKLSKMPGVDTVDSPYVALHIADMRGIDSQPTLSINNNALVLEPGSQLAALPSGLHVPLDDALISGGSIALSLSLTLRGLESLAFVSLGDTSELHMQSDWPHPEFVGASLPRERTVSADGFSAQWTRTKYASNTQALFETCASEGDCGPLLTSAVGARFIEPVDIYLQSERSLKYAMLFIALSFVCFFVFEHLKQIRIHPIQYAFVGLAIATFYLLLISIAEHFSFATAYGVAVSCCCCLLLYYVRYLFQSLAAAILFSGMTAALYGLLYIIVQAEDFALLMGSMLVFAVLTTTMVVTRHIDWYELGEQ